MADLKIADKQDADNARTRLTFPSSQRLHQHRSGGQPQSSSQNRYQRSSTTQMNREYYTSRSYSTNYDFGNKKVITIPSQNAGRIIGKGGCKIRELMSESNAHIKVHSSTSSETNVTLSGSTEAIMKAQELIDTILENTTPSRDKNSIHSDKTDEQTSNFFKVNDEGIQVQDWEKLNAHYEKLQKDRWDNLPPIIKDFYKENPTVSNMSSDAVRMWRRNNFDVQVRRTFEEHSDLRPIPNPVMTFEQAFQNYPEILKEIHKQGFSQPTPIQCQAWPILLRGEDMVGIAQTGTGKTLAFLLPALVHIDGQTIPKEEREGPTVLILAPTRELAIQIYKEVTKYQYKNITSICLYGGGDRKNQIKSISKGVDIVVATPGRLNDLILARHLNIINFSYIVLDEADRMLDMGFEPQIRKSLFDVRPDRQTVMTSATWPPGVRSLAQSYMKDPIQVIIGSLDLTAVHTVTQNIMFVEEEMKEKVLLNFIWNMNKDDKVIIFCGKKATATHITTELCLKGIECQSLHGDRDQSDREAALSEMVDGTVNILVATDVASRGIDIQDLTHVINFDFPRHIEEYVHRVGRTGRAGKMGIALSFVTRRDWAHARDLIKILEEANQEVPIELETMARNFEAMKLRKTNWESNNKHSKEGYGSSNTGRKRY